MKPLGLIFGRSIHSRIESMQRVVQAHPHAHSRDGMDLLCTWLNFQVPRCFRQVLFGVCRSSILGRRLAPSFTM